MPVSERAKQFSAFDAVKGLREALIIKENEHDMIIQKEVPEDDARRISNTLLGLNGGETAKVSYFENGFEKQISGKVKLKFNDGKLIVDSTEIKLSSLTDIEII